MKLGYTKFLLLIGYILISSAGYAQYKGGDASGYAQALASATNNTENKELESPELSPNPVLAAGIVGFRYTGATPPERIAVYTLNKQLVKQIIPETLSKWTFFTAPVNKGIYLIEFNYGSFKTYSKLVVTN
ncbi:MAG TPA: hypothetical protein DCQ31_17720 [Bacteroidales bacterium]|nr:hypothetical protein [Bacteroidales bacterium]